MNHEPMDKVPDLSCSFCCERDNKDYYPTICGRCGNRFGQHHYNHNRADDRGGAHKFTAEDAQAGPGCLEECEGFEFDDVWRRDMQVVLLHLTQDLGG